jgi:hypothetical protein
LLITILLFKATYERDNVQEGEGTRNPNTKKARIPPSLRRYDRLYAGLLKSRPCMHKGMKPGPMTWGYPSEVVGYISFAQQQNLPHSRGGVSQITLAQ